MNVLLSPLLLEKMTEGFILLNQEGRITDFNRAAKPWLKHCMGSSAALAHLIGQIRASKIQAPVPVDTIFQNTTGSGNFFLCKCDSDAFAIVVTALSPNTSASISSNKDGLFALLGEDFRHGMTKFRQQLCDWPIPEVDDTPTKHLLEQSQYLSRLLIFMEQLCELHAREEFFQDDRINLRELIESTLAALPVRRSDFRVNTALSDANEKQGMLFGNSVWLGIALQALLEGLGDSAPPHCQIEIRVRQSGGFVVMTGQFSQFFDRQTSAATSPLTHTARPSSALEANIRSTICERIIALHGGQLKVVAPANKGAEQSTGGMESFTLTLPTGAPLKGRQMTACATCLAPRQAEQYAQDLVELLMMSGTTQHPK